MVKAKTTKTKAKAPAKKRATKVVSNPWSGEVIAANIRKNAEQIAKNISANAERVGDRMKAYLNRNLQY